MYRTTMLRKDLIALAFLASPIALLAQSPCAEYHKFNCDRSGDKRFSPNGQSKSAAVQVGQETELNIIIYRGQDYRISLCHDDKVLGEKLAFRLVEKVRSPKSEVGADGRTEYEETEKVLWDNTEHEMDQAVEFTSTSTKRIAIEIVAPGGAESPKAKDGQSYDIGCVGILIEHMPTPQMGF
ncbi:MAG: hypothetical protein MUE88_04670 [Flavobacteriales bacterium]|jgi:hypothetical protein|nr:hypothetical protein [Flavobacteriales bacterium]